MSFDCNDCNGQGLIFWGNELDYDVEKCDCNDFAIGNLFTTKEAD
jgi:hypothetical protein